MSAIRLRLDLAYDGTGFAGWASQPDRRTVQGELTAALTTVLRPPEPVRLTVAGRTDAGVHARGQVAHVDIDPDAHARLPGRSERSPEAALLSRLGGILPPDIAVRDGAHARVGCAARCGARARPNLTRTAAPPATRDPLRRHDTLWWPRSLDAAAMGAASRELVGLKDFAAFCRRREGATTIRTLLEYSWVRLPDGVLAATVRADAFCHSMVRSLVGAAVTVGEGRRSVDWPEAMQRRGERTGIPVLAPHGLSLEEVRYPPDADLAARASSSRARRDPRITA
ncbi:MAG: tRNA pseudouridine synthase A [Micrococcales bacterium]|nr:tRNA pseudouridine synthase A [Micrococcales bacterium]